MSMTGDVPSLRRQLHAAQRELAPISKDDIYKVDALLQLAYTIVPQFYDRLEFEMALQVQGAE